MPTGLAALGDQDVRAGVKRLMRLVERLHLGDQRNTGRTDAVGERLQVTERQHDRRRLPLQRLDLAARACGPDSR